MRASRGSSLAVVALVVTALAFPATRAGGQGAPIAAPPTTPNRLVGSEPRDAYKQLVPGLLVRTRYVAEGRPAVEIWDLMVGPGKQSDRARLPGAAVIEVRAGRGVLKATKSAPLRTGAILTLADAEEFTLSNGEKDQALILRATVIPGPAR